MSEADTRTDLAYDRAALTRILKRARVLHKDAVSTYAIGWWDGYIRFAEVMLGIEREEEQ